MAFFRWQCKREKDLLTASAFGGSQSCVQKKIFLSRLRWHMQDAGFGNFHFVERPDDPVYLASRNTQGTEIKCPEDDQSERHRFAETTPAGIHISGVPLRGQISESMNESVTPNKVRRRQAMDIPVQQKQHVRVCASVVEKNCRRGDEWLYLAIRQGCWGDQRWNDGTMEP